MLSPFLSVHPLLQLYFPLVQLFQLNLKYDLSALLYFIRRVSNTICSLAPTVICLVETIKINWSLCSPSGATEQLRIGSCQISDQWTGSVSRRRRHGQRERLSFNRPNIWTLWTLSSCSELRSLGYSDLFTARERRAKTKSKQHKCAL